MAMVLKTIVPFWSRRFESCFCRHPYLCVRTYHPFSPVSESFLPSSSVSPERGFSHTLTENLRAAGSVWTRNFKIQVIHMGASNSIALSVNTNENGRWASIMLVFQLPEHIEPEPFAATFQELLRKAFQMASGKNVPADAVIMSAIAALQCKVSFEFLATKADAVSFFRYESITPTES